MARRSYKQFCGLARALDVVGERWTLLIVRNLLLGPRRYGELLEGLPGITTNLLAQRLHELQDAGLVENVELDGVARWRLTALGASLETVVLELGRFGQRWMQKPHRGDALNIGWALISLKRRFRGGFDGRVLALIVRERKRERSFELSARGSQMLVLERTPQRADASVQLSDEALRALLFAGASVEALLARGELRIEGDASVLHAWLGALAPMPAAPAQPPSQSRRS